jgi:hypothetical protein
MAPTGCLLMGGSLGSFVLFSYTFFAIDSLLFLFSTGRVQQAAILRVGRLKILLEIFKRRSVRLLPRLLLLRPG